MPGIEVIPVNEGDSVPAFKVLSFLQTCGIDAVFLTGRHVQVRSEDRDPGHNT